MSDEEETSAAQVEATGADTIEVAYDGRDWTLPASADALRYSEIRAFESGNLGEVLEAVLPPRQHRIIVQENPRAPWLKGLIDAWLEAAGIDLGG